MGSAGDTAPDAIFTTPVKAAHFAMLFRSSGFYYNGSIWRMIAGPFDASAAAPAPAPAPAAAIQALPYDAELLDGSSSGDSDASGGGTTAASRRLRQQGDADAEDGVDLSLSPPDMPVGPPAAAARTRLGLWLTTPLWIARLASTAAGILLQPGIYSSGELVSLLPCLRPASSPLNSRAWWMEWWLQTA